MSETSPQSVATGERPGATAPIDIAPQRRPGSNRVRRFVQSGADWLHLTFASAVVLGVFLQVYLIGAYIFGAGQGALDAHRTAGFALQGPELFVLLTALIAWLPRIDLLLSFLLAIIGFVQAGLANAHQWVGGLTHCSPSSCSALPRRSHSAGCTATAALPRESPFRDSGEPAAHIRGTCRCSSQARTLEDQELLLLVSGVTTHVPAGSHDRDSRRLSSRHAIR